MEKIVTQIRKGFLLLLKHIYVCVQPHLFYYCIAKNFSMPGNNISRKLAKRYILNAQLYFCKPSVHFLPV